MPIDVSWGTAVFENGAEGRDSLFATYTYPCVPVGRVINPGDETEANLWIIYAIL